ncbi:family S53 protease-like protein [Mycena epipterygia]|nr:family S53 protease-like protein [Mycena epipterygia]
MALRKCLTVLPIITAVYAGMFVHESRSAAPAGFVSQGAAPGGEMITLRVALASNNVVGLEQKLMSISTPGSSEFRQWLSMDEVKNFVEPSPDTVAAFNSFSSANDLKPTVISPNGDWVSITLPVSQANELFDAQFEVFTHPSITNTIVRTLSVSLPSELVGHVDVIHPTTDFVLPSARLAPVYSNFVGPATPESCNTSVASGVMKPTCLQDLYSIPAAPATQKNNSLVVTAYGGQFAERADLAAFLELFRPDIPPNTTFTLLSVDSGVDPQNISDAGSEASLDIQYTTGIATEVPIEFLSHGVGNGSAAALGTAFLDTATFLDGVPSPPAVMTTSYGGNEVGFGRSLATKVCNGYMALTSRGASVVWSSGDGGVHGNKDTPSVCNDTVFVPVFPATCPFVTAVGSTQGFGPEKAANFSSGGFSNFFPMPSYQTAAVDGFLKTIPTDFAGTFNTTGCGYPDVAVQGWNFEIVVRNKTGLLSGTSASAPTFAAIIALINDRLIAAGKPVLGFLNPFLYSNASKAFTDITIGHNSGLFCPSSSVAFDAAVGWDALTGFGTPIFPELLAAALA